jgi:hypothetical protein
MGILCGFQFTPMFMQKYKTQRFAVAFVSAILLYIGCYAISESQSLAK